MRWVEHQIGDKRVSSGFLWLPKTIDGETRWLEKATWKEEYNEYWLVTGLSNSNSFFHDYSWDDIEWVD